MTYSKITLNSLLLATAFCSRCYCSDDPFNIVFQENSSSEQTSEIFSPRTERGRSQSLSETRRSSSCEPQIETTTNQVNNNRQSLSLFSESKTVPSLPVSYPVPKKTQESDNCSLESLEIFSPKRTYLSHESIPVGNNNRASANDPRMPDGTPCFLTLIGKEGSAFAERVNNYSRPHTPTANLYGGSTPFPPRETRRGPSPGLSLSSNSSNKSSALCPEIVRSNTSRGSLTRKPSVSCGPCTSNSSFPLATPCSINSREVFDPFTIYSESRVFLSPLNSTVSASYSPSLSRTSTMDQLEFASRSNSNQARLCSPMVMDDQNVTFQAEDLPMKSMQQKSLKRSQSCRSFISNTHPEKDNNSLAASRLKNTAVGREQSENHGESMTPRSTDYDNYKFVLSIDGGGVRGIMPAIILRNVCGKLGDDFKFDMIAGTSVGALVASSFALGKIDHFINDYNTLSKKIFTSNWSYWNPLNWFGIIRGLRGPAYRVDSKERAIRDFIGTEDENTYSLDKIGTRLLVPFYLQQNSCVAFYKNYDEISNKNVHKYSLVDSLMATTAAPTFFNPHIFQGLDGCRYEGIDGGAFAINPALVVYQESRLLFPQSRIVLLSLGTGDHNYIDNDFESTDRGNLFWAKKYPTVTNCAMTTYTHQFLTERSSADKLDYFRVNPHLVQHLCNSMDNTSPAHIETLKTYTNKTIAESSSDFYKFVERAKNIKKL